MTDRNLLKSGGVFQTGHGSTVYIHSDQFVQHTHIQNTHNCYEATDGFQHLHAHVATSAFDSQDHVDAPKCHPSTRKIVLDEIMNWIILTVTRIQWVLWLNGAAGAGKSAICRSIVDWCIEQKIPIARFFFFRTDSTRNNTKYLVSTLVHQLLQTIPDLKPIVIPRIEADCLIFTKSLKTQFEYLIFGPLRELKHNSIPFQMLVLLFDGVDECNSDDDQAALIRIVADFVGSREFPVIAFFASRIEDQISMVFRSAALSNITCPLPLDNNYLADDDIRVFLNDSFDEIKHTHRSAQFLSNDWPAASDVEQIVEKSSGQFIYASVVLKFCAAPNNHPENQLKIILALQPCGTLTPFAQLDALYQHIFSQVPNYPLVSLILAWQIITRWRALRITVYHCAEFCGLEIADLLTALAPLQSVIDCTNAYDIHFLHASLPDFLLDNKRSQEYHINCSIWSAHLSVMAHKLVMAYGDQVYIPVDMYLSDAEATPELKNCVLAFNPKNKFNLWRLVYYLRRVKKLDFGDGPGGAVYQQKLYDFVSHAKEEDPDDFYDGFTEQGHDISNILQEIESEFASMVPETEAIKGQNQDQSGFLTAVDEEVQQHPVTGEDQHASTAQNLVQREIKSNPMVPWRNIFRALGKSKNHKTAGQDTGTHHAEGETSSVGRVKFGLTRLFKR